MKSTQKSRLLGMLGALNMVCRIGDILALQALLVGLVFLQIGVAQPAPPQPVGSKDRASVKDQLLQECKIKNSMSGVSSQYLQGKEASSDISEILSRSFACEALARKDPTSCASLKSGKGPVWRERYDGCRGSYFNLRFIEAAVRGSKEAPGFCAEMFSGSLSPYRAADVPKACAAIAASIRDRKPNICGALAAFLDPTAVSRKDFTASCQDNMNYMAGESACAGIWEHIKGASASGRKRLREGCVDNAGVFQAVGSGQIARCGSSGLCRALLASSNQPCLAMHDTVIGLYCSEIAERKYKTAVDEEKRRAKVQVDEEIGFRKANDLAPYKEGDPFLHSLPPNERIKYEKNPRREQEERMRSQSQGPSPGKPKRKRRTPPPGSKSPL